MFDSFLSKLFGIMKRAYYLTIISVSVGSVLSLAYFYIFTNQADPDWERIGYICLLAFPIGALFHKIVHWVIWGKLTG